MAVTDLRILPLGGGAWRLTWSTTLPADPRPVFAVWRDGTLATITAERALIVTLADGESPVFEVLDDPAALPTPVFPGRVSIQWLAPAGGAGVEHYLVQELLGAVWTTRERVRESGRGYYRWTSRYLADDVVHDFRVIAVGTNGNDGTAAAVSALMVRHPDPPAVAFAYDPTTGNVTISAA